MKNWTKDELTRVSERVAQIASNILLCICMIIFISGAVNAFLAR